MLNWLKLIHSDGGKDAGQCSHSFVTDLLKGRHSSLQGCLKVVQNDRSLLSEDVVFHSLNCMMLFILSRNESVHGCSHVWGGVSVMEFVG